MLYTYLSLLIRLYIVRLQSRHTESGLRNSSRSRRKKKSQNRYSQRLKSIFKSRVAALNKHQQNLGKVRDIFSILLYYKFTKDVLPVALQNLFVKRHFWNTVSTNNSSVSMEVSQTDYISHGWRLLTGSASLCSLGYFNTTVVSCQKSKVL